MKELLKLCKLNNLTIAELVYLYSIKYPEIDVENAYPNSQELVEKGFLQRTEPLEYKLTDEGFSMIVIIEGLFKKTKGKKIPRELTPENSRIKEYLDLWPNMTLPSGKPARASEKVIYDAFTYFFTHYNHTWNEVMAATQDYLWQQEDKKYSACRTSQYFIVKQIGGTKESTLADVCIMLQNRDASDDPFTFKEKVV